jgi:hypothetical protein
LLLVIYIIRIVVLYKRRNYVLLANGRVGMARKIIYSMIALACMMQAAGISADARTASKSNTKSRGHHPHGYSGLVPPPPPMAVSPTVLAMYPTSSTGFFHFTAKKPRTLAEDMKLTAVMDDVAFFKLNSGDESIHLKAGNSYETVKVAQINPDEVVLEEKGHQFVKHLK